MNKKELEKLAEEGAVEQLRIIKQDFPAIWKRVVTPVTRRTAKAEQPKKRRRLSRARRKAISEARKKWWAEQRVQ